MKRLESSARVSGCTEDTEVFDLFQGLKNFTRTGSEFAEMSIREFEGWEQSQRLKTLISPVMAAYPTSVLVEFL